MGKKSTKTLQADFIIENNILIHYNGKGKKVIIPSHVTIIGKNAFKNCHNLITIYIPNSVTKIEARAFSGCSNLKEVFLPNSIVEIGAWAFLGCYHLKNISIPNSVKMIGNAAFSNCNHLITITIPNSVTIIGAWLFMNCSHLIRVVLPSSITSMIVPNMFDSCPSLEEVIMEPGNTNYITSDGVLFKKVTSGLELVLYPANKKGQTYHIPDNVISIAGNAFLGCHELTHIFIPDSVTTIGMDAFCNCNNLIEISCHSNVLQQ